MRCSLDEEKNRDCDLIISVNMLTFYVLWKIEKYEESMKYLSVCRKAMAILLDEDFASEKN